MAWHPTWNEPPRRGLFFDSGGTPPATLLILISTVGVFIFDALTRGLLSELGALTVRSVLELQVWRLVTYQFLHAGLTHIFWNLFLLWMLGATLERQLGSPQFLALYLLSGVFGGVCEVVFNLLMHYQFGAVFYHLSGRTFLDLPAVGASAGVAGVLVAFAVVNPRVQFLLFFLFPIQARWLAIGYLVITSVAVWQGLVAGRLDNVAHAAHLGGMVMGYLWVKRYAWAGDWWDARVRRHEQFIRRTEAEEQAEIDRILDKIHSCGVDSLTLRERLFLQEVSRRRRGGF